jgi:hypothetical protein
MTEVRLAFLGGATIYQDERKFQATAALFQTTSPSSATTRTLVRTVSVVARHGYGSATALRLKPRSRLSILILSLACLSR